VRVGWYSQTMVLCCRKTVQRSERHHLDLFRLSAVSALSKT
jgi:hypothetical protein